MDNLPPFDWFQPKKTNYDLCERANSLPIERFESITIITIMWEGNLPPFDRFQKKNITIMRWGKLLPNDRFEKKKNYNYARGQFST